MSTPTEQLAPRLAAFLKRRMPQAKSVEVSDCTRLTGGYSCITHRFTALIDGKPVKLIARSDTPRDQKVIDSGDRYVEWKLLSALTQDGRAPMPKALYCDEDGSETGERTIIIEYKEKGSFLTYVRAANDTELKTFADQFADLAAGIHLIDPAALPANVTRPPSWDSYIDDVIDTWRQVEADHIGADPLLRYMALWLTENRPPPAPLTLVHGEFQVANTVIGDDGLPLAIDWEFAHIGDPREDLGWALLVGSVTPPDLVGLDLERFCQRYRERTGLGADIINPVTVIYFSILPSLKIFGPILEQQRAIIAGNNTSIQAAYMAGGYVTAQEQWRAAVRRIEAAREMQ